jgi:uncharacterized membrane protein YGL010W
MGGRELEQLSLTPALRSRVENYGRVHRSPVNRALHYIGIPFLGIASLGLLCQLSLPIGIGIAALEPNAAWPALVFAAGWYIWLGGAVGLLPLAVVVGCYVIGSLLSTVALVVLFAAGAVAHLIGHYGFEGKPPAFFSNPLSVLAAPAWLVSIIGGRD